MLIRIFLLDNQWWAELLNGCDFEIVGPLTFAQAMLLEMQF